MPHSPWKTRLARYLALSSATAASGDIHSGVGDGTLCIGAGLLDRPLCFAPSSYAWSSTDVDWNLRCRKYTTSGYCAFWCETWTTFRRTSISGYCQVNGGGTVLSLGAINLGQAETWVPLGWCVRTDLQRATCDGAQTSQQSGCNEQTIYIALTAFGSQGPMNGWAQVRYQVDGAFEIGAWAFMDSDAPIAVGDTGVVPSPLYPNIQSAIDAASNGDVIRIAPGVHTEAIDFSGKSITIVGDPSNPDSVILDGASLDEPIVRADSGESGAVLRGVTLRNGRAGSPIPGAPSTRAGGGFYAWETAVTVEDCVFEANASTLGGGAFCRMGAITFRRCTFVLNECGAYGGGLNLSRCEGAAIDDCIFADNTAGASGGGFHAFGGSPVLTGCTFQTNLAQAPGGGLSWDAGGQGPARLENSAVVNNTSLTGGGGVTTLFGTAPAINVLGTEICGNDPDQITGGFVDLGGNDICQCLADLSGDGQVNGTDLGLWLTYTLGPCDPKTPCPADLDGDGVIAGGDLGALLAAWGPCAN